MKDTFEQYAKNLQLEQLFSKLGTPDPRKLAKTAEHFSRKEAGKRDEIVLNYFGQAGINRIVNAITDRLLDSPKLSAKAKVLDVGAGSGFFTTKIKDKIQAQLPKVSFYAMDLTPAMLVSLTSKHNGITAFVGIAENLQDSIKEAKKHFNVPSKFEAVYSTLMLHHSLEPEKVFKSIKTVLKKGGKAIIVDLCEHHFEEFKMELGDEHLGFKPRNIHEMASKHFSAVKVEKLEGICCKSSGRSAEIFVASMLNC
jgi:SAM-dependent methyltransferase